MNISQPNVGEHCRCGAYLGGACDGWCYARSELSNWEISILLNRLDDINEALRIALGDDIEGMERERIEKLAENHD